MESLQPTLPLVEQEALQGTPTPRRSRVSSIFQQKTIKQDDIDTDFLKHVAFAAQRSSPSPPATEAHSAYQQADQAAISKVEPVALPAAVQLADTASPLLADMQPEDPGEFTLDKIEQSIAEIEAELGWASDSAAISAAASTTIVLKSSLAPPSILSSSHTGRPLATSISSTGTPTATPPQGKRLSFLGEVAASDCTRASTENLNLARDRTESRSGAAMRSTADVGAALESAALAESRSTATANSTVPFRAAGSMPTLKAVPLLDVEASQPLLNSLSKADLAAPSSQPLQGSTLKLQLSSAEELTSQSLEGASRLQLISQESTPSQSLENSVSKRQLTSAHSMQSDTTHDGSKKRTVRHSLSGKLTTPPGALVSSSTYSSRYATRQLSGKASPSSIDGALSPRRSLLASPAASVHGGLPTTLQLSNKPGSSRPAKGDDWPGATLAGAADVLKIHARPSSIDGAGWHLATGDGLPFSPRGSLVASSGGSRTLRPIASQQEALFDAEGNMLPKSAGQPQQTEPAAQTDSKIDQNAPGSAAAAECPVKQKVQNLGPDTKTMLNSADTAAGGLPAKQKPPAKHGVLSMVMFPCFCLRPRTTSAEDPYPQRSLRQRFAAKEAAAAGPPPALANKGGPVPRSALKQKQPSDNVAPGVRSPDWDLGTEVHHTDAADVRLSEKAVQGEEAQDGRSLEGAISLAPKRHGLAAQQPQQTTLQQASEGHASEAVVSPAASFTSAGASVRGSELGSQYGSADAPAAESQPQSQTQSRPQTRSGTQEAEAETALASEAASPADTSTAAAPGVSRVDDMESADGGAGRQDLTWSNGTGSSELGALGMTGRSVSSKSGTRRRKEWEGPEGATPAEVSQSLEDIMLQRFPELEPLLLQSSFTNKQAPWRGPKSGHTSHSPSRGHSLGVSREASFTHSRPESRQGRLPTSQLGGPRASPGLPHEQAQPPAMQPDTQSDMQPEEATNMQLEMRTEMHSGTQSWQAASSNSFPDAQTEQDDTTADTISGVVQQDGIQDVHAVGDSSSSMSLVEAAALAASSPGAIVRVPTSTTLSQADQIALRYQHQVQFQLQQALGSSGGLPPTPTARSGSKSPTRRSPTKHKPFHLSDSPWKRDSAQLGQPGSQPSALSPAASQTAPSRRGRSTSKLPIRTARSQKVSGAPEKRPTSSKGSSKGAPATRVAERQPERQRSSPAHGQGGVAGLGSHAVMSFGTYGGVAFSSFTPEVPAGSSDMGAEDEDDWADDSGKWGELTKSRSSALPVRVPQPKHSSISLADIARDAAENRAADEGPEPSYSMRAQRVIEPGGMEGKDGGSQSYLLLLESLAQEGELGSPGNSDNDSSPAATQACVVEQPWGADHLPGVGPWEPTPRGSYKAAAAEECSQLSEASSTFGDAAVEALLPLEASAMHMDDTEGHLHHGASDRHTHVRATSGGRQASDAGTAGDEQAARQLAEAEDQPSSLALALAALAATAAQKHADQTSMQQPQPDAADFNEAQTADEDVDEQASVSSDSDCDVLATAAAAAAAAGLSCRQVDPPHAEQAAQLWPAVVSASALATATEAQADPSKPLQDADAGSSQVAFHTEYDQQAQQEGRRQRDSASGSHLGPGSSGPSWSTAADGAAAIGLFRENQAVNYVGKSARRPKVATPNPKAGRLHGLFSKLRRGASKEEEELDSSRPASIAAPTSLGSQTEPSPITKSGSWIPKAFSQPHSETGAGSANPSAPLQARTRFADQPLLDAAPLAQPDRQETQPALGPLPSSKAPQETFTALPSLPVPAAITGDPVLAAPASPRAVSRPDAIAIGEAQAGSSRVTFTKASSLLVVQQEDTTMQSDSGSDFEDYTGDMFLE